MSHDNRPSFPPQPKAQHVHSALAEVGLLLDLEGKNNGYYWSSRLVVSIWRRAFRERQDFHHKMFSKHIHYPYEDIVSVIFLLSSYFTGTRF